MRIASTAVNSRKRARTGRILFLSLFAFGAAVGAVYFQGSPTAFAACAYPSQVLDLANWKETLPIGSSGSPTEIKQTLLATYAHDIYFRANAECSGVIFKAPVNGVTTSGSGYPRSELREMANNGTTNASWSTTSGVHTMIIDQAITAVPKAKRHVVAGQIHDSSDDVIVIRLEYPKLFIDINGKTGPTLDANYTLGKRFVVKFVASGGQIKVYYNGSATPSYTLSKSGSGNYFKAGAYTQSNCSKETVCDSSNYGEVAIYNLLVQHGSGSTVTSDTTKPAVSLSAPASGATVSGSVALSATASDNVGVTGVQFKVDGANVGSEDTASPYGVAWDSAAVSDGSHTVSAVARDAAGNTATASIAVTASNAAPAPTPTVSGTSFEAESGVVTAPMQILSDASALGGKYIVQTTDTGTGSAQYTVAIPATGQYQIRARVIAPDGSSNSVYYAVDSNSSNTWSFPDTLTNWAWVDGPTVALSQGTHTLSIKKREKGTKLDAFELKPLSTGTSSSAIDGTTPFEAEIGTASGGMQVLSDDALASGGKYVRAGSSGSMTYQVNVPVSGTYRVAGWIKTADGSSDSFYLSIDGSSSATWTLASPASAWTYDLDDGHTFSLGAGTHTIALKYREAGAKIDKLVLVKQ